MWYFDVMIALESTRRPGYVTGGMEGKWRLVYNFRVNGRAQATSRVTETCPTTHDTIILVWPSKQSISLNVR